MISLKTILFMSLFSMVTMLQAQESVDKGYFLPNDFVIKNFSVMKLVPEEDYLAKHIVKVNYKISRAESLEISQAILKVSNCFQVDPWILASLIQKESSFQKDSVSPTNAAGLTQFTSMGFKEVNDQLGFRGREGASAAAINYFNGKINDCIDPNWIHLWKKVALPEAHEDFYMLSKEEIKKDILVAVTYGAILLKTYVASVDAKNFKANVESSTSETYYQALQNYNGENGEAKVRYAKSIFQALKVLYPSPINFTFLD